MMYRLLLVALIATSAWAISARPFEEEPMKVIVGDEEIIGNHHPSGQGLSPGDSIDYTYYDYQRNGQTAWQVWYDDADGIHALLMSAHQPDFSDRNCVYNFKLGGSWYGRLEVGGYAGAGYVTEGYQPSDNAAVAGYHMREGGSGTYRCWVSVDDGGQGGYSFTEHAVLPQITGEEIIWPRMAVDDQGNFHVVNHSYNNETILYTRSTDGGNTWEDTTVLYEEGSGSGPGRNLAGGCFADRWSTPGKVIRYWTEWTGEGTAGTAQHAQDVCYSISTDNGASWDAKVNLTQYQASDTMRAFCHVKAIFDGNGDPHIFFPTLYFVGGTAYVRSWIMHWSPSTGFTKVTGPISFTANNPGAWKLPTDFPGPAIDKSNGWMYLVYTLGRESDLSQGGFPNGELMALASTDGGATWVSNAVGDTGVNLTKTPTPNGAPGQCADDDYPSVSPYVVSVGGVNSLVIEYIEDKDAGGIPHGEGTATENPCRVYVVPTDSVIRVAEEEPGIPKLTRLVKVYPNPATGLTRVSYALAKDARVRISVLDITGRVVDNLVDQVVGAGYHTAFFKSEVPAGVYFVQMETEDYRATESVILVR